MRQELPYKDKYLVYIRRSTDDSDSQQNSIEYQKKEILKYVKSANLPIASMNIEGFCESGFIIEKHTGFKEDKDLTIRDDGSVQYYTERPKFHKLTQLMNDSAIRGVIALCWDRISRNKSDNSILNKLMKQGSDVHFVLVRYENNSGGELYRDIDGVFAEHHSRVTSEKIRFALTKLRDEGICTYRAPIGYLNQGNPYYKPFDPERAPIIKQIFEKYVEGTWSLIDLAKWANEQGLTMPAVRRKRSLKEMLSNKELVIDKVCRPITFNHIHWILRNRFYIGEIRGNGRKWVPSKSHAPIIDPVLFYRAESILAKKNVSVHYTDKIYFPYRGIVRCFHCNRVYTPYEKKGIHYYGSRCCFGCSNTLRSINSAFIEDTIGEKISQLFYSEDELREIDSRIKTVLSILEERRKKEAVEIEREKRKTQEEIQYLQMNKLTLLKSGVFTPQDYINEEMRLEKKLEEIANKEDSADIPLNQVVKDLVKLSEILRDAYLYYKLANPSEKQQIITKVFSEIRFSHDTLAYQCRNGFRVLEDRSFVFGDPGRNRTCIITSAKLRPIH